MSVVCLPSCRGRQGPSAEDTRPISGGPTFQTSEQLLRRSLVERCWSPTSLEEQAAGWGRRWFGARLRPQAVRRGPPVTSWGNRPPFLEKLRFSAPDRHPSLGKVNRTGSQISERNRRLTPLLPPCRWHAVNSRPEEPDSPRGIGIG